MYFHLHADSSYMRIFFVYNSENLDVENTMTAKKTKSGIKSRNNCQSEDIVTTLIYLESRTVIVKISWGIKVCEFRSRLFFREL